MPKFNPIFTFSKIYLKLTKKSSYFCIFKLFHKKYLNFIQLAFEENIDSILKNVEKPVKEALFEMFGDTITFVSAYVEMNAEELKVFKQEKALTLKMKLDENKSKKYNELFKRDNFFFQMSASQNKCNLCGNEIDDDIERCSTCNAIEHISDFYTKDTFNKLGYKTKINTHTTSCINLFLDIYLYSEYRLIYC